MVGGLKGGVVVEAICLKIEGCWEVVTSGKGGRGCGSPGGGKGLVGGLKGVVVEAICLRLKGVGKWLQVERAGVRVGLRAAGRVWWAD